jgi:hypothetical protein
LDPLLDLVVYAIVLMFVRASVPAPSGMSMGIEETVSVSKDDTSSKQEKSPDLSREMETFTEIFELPCQ